VVEWRFCRGFCHFWCAERGELAGKTWWSCGESVAASTSKSAPLKNANLYPHFSIFFSCVENID
jgi:hypothetical protein